MPTVTVRRMFAHEPGVINLRHEQQPSNRRYRILRIPRRVLNRVFSAAEMTRTLSEFAASNTRKAKLIELGLRMLKMSESTDKAAFLCLVNPKPTVEGTIDWTVLGKGIPADEREAVVTRRVFAGYLPVGCCLQQGSGWGMVVDKAFVPEDLQDIYVAFARVEMFLIAKTLDGKAEPEDSAMFPVAWSDRSYPGQPVKPRKPGTFRVEVDIPNRSMRVVNPFNRSFDLPLDEDFIEGADEERDAIYAAQHVIAALGEAPPPKGTTPGDVFEIYLMRAEGTPKLLACVPAEVAVPSGMTGMFGMGGAA